MNLIEAIKKMPLKYRGRVTKICQIVSDKLSDELFDNLSSDKLKEFEQISKYDKQAMINFVLNNFPDLEDKAIRGIISYVEEKYNLG